MNVLNFMVGTILCKRKDALNDITFHASCRHLKLHIVMAGYLKLRVLHLATIESKQNRLRVIIGLVWNMTEKIPILP